MSLVISYLTKRPDNYKELEEQLNKTAAIGFAKFPDAEVFASWNGSHWQIDSRPKDFWLHCVADTSQNNQG